MSDERRSTIAYRWMLAVVLAVICSIGGCAWYAFTYDPELSHAAGWAALQGFELDSRSRPYAEPEIRRTNDGRFAALAIFGVGQPNDGPTDPPQVLPGKAWVLLNEHAADKTVSIMPRFTSYKVSCVIVGQLPSAVPDVDGYVLVKLSKMCR